MHPGRSILGCFAQRPLRGRRLALLAEGPRASRSEGRRKSLDRDVDERWLKHSHQICRRERNQEPATPAVDIEALEL